MDLERYEMPGPGQYGSVTSKKSFNKGKLAKCFGTGVKRFETRLI